MTRESLVLIGLLTAAHCHAQDATTPAGAFQAGQAFARGAGGTASATGAVNASGAAAGVPGYDVSVPQSAVYGGGKAPIGEQGRTKIAGCDASLAPTAYQQQECDAVKYLQRMPVDRPRFTLDPVTDPVMVQSKGTISHPGNVPVGPAPVCHIEKVTVPGTSRTETCEQSTVLDSFACDRTVVASCGNSGKAIGASAMSSSGAFLQPVLTATDTPGLYGYRLEVPDHTCSTDGSSEIRFTLDTVGLGGYVTINLGNLDDAAAVGVNGTTVFAGYPNAGPHYGSETFGSQAGFEMGYAWQEDIGTDVCTTYDAGGACTGMQHVPDMQTLHAGVKLLDSCPAGYPPIAQRSLRTCDADTGACSVVSTDTSVTVPGFFCNSEGRFLMNRHEGVATWSGTVTGTLPLKAGENRIAVYWGTGTGRNTCGNVLVHGEIYNVAPACTTTIDDQCASARAALKQ